MGKPFKCLLYSARILSEKLRRAEEPQKVKGKGQRKKRKKRRFHRGWGRFGGSRPGFGRWVLLSQKIRFTNLRGKNRFSAPATASLLLTGMGSAAPNLKLTNNQQGGQN